MAEEWDEKTQGGAKRKGSGLRPLADSLQKVTRRSLGRQGLGQGGLLHDWPDVVGPQIAAVCQPRRLSFPNRERRSDGTLTLRVAPGQAVLLQHIEPQIRERVNGYLGYAAVARLRLQPGALGKPLQAPPPPPRRVLTPEAERRLKAKTDNIDDPELRAALDRLGRAVMGQPRKRDNTGL